jgi:hypothetical protein
MRGVDQTFLMQGQLGRWSIFTVPIRIHVSRRMRPMLVG